MTSNPSDPLEGLFSESPSVRARSAFWLIQNPEKISVQDLMLALRAESVPRIRQTLLRVLALRQGANGDSNRDRIEQANDAVSPVGDQNQLDLAALIYHELSPAIGWIRLAADREIDNFSQSDTNEAVRQLQRRINGLVAIVQTGEKLNIVSRNLPQILKENWPDRETPPIFSSSMDDDEVEIETDEGLFALLLSNIYQNAIDAWNEDGRKSDVHINWGFDDQSYWMRITNPFAGERFTLDDVLDVGKSTKASHQGRGLTLVRNIAERMDLAITLEGRSGLASFTLSGTRSNG